MSWKINVQAEEVERVLGLRSLHESSVVDIHDAFGKSTEKDTNVALSDDMLGDVINVITRNETHFNAHGHIQKLIDRKNITN